MVVPPSISFQFNRNLHVHTPRNQRGTGYDPRLVSFVTSSSRTFPLHQGNHNHDDDDKENEQEHGTDHLINDPGDSSEEQIFYNDFDFTAGDLDGIGSIDLDDNWSIRNEDSTASLWRSDNNNNNPTLDSQLVLSEFEKVLEEESKRKTLIERNWQSGNWKCRGFSLDKERPDRIVQQSGGGEKEERNESDHDRENHNNVVKISHIALDETVTSSSRHDDALGFGACTEMIAVARTDGTVYVVTLGDEYLTNFRARLLLQSGKSDGADERTVFRVGMEMVNENEEEIDKDGISSNEFSVESWKQQTSSLLKSPFEIECQFQAHGTDEPISALLFHDDTLFTASKISGQVKSWKIDHVDGKAVVMPSHHMDGVHKDEIVALKTLSHGDNAVDVNDHNLLLSASRDGSFAIWDMNGDLVYRCEMMSEDGNLPVNINCADVDTSCSSEHIIYLGLSDGYVVGYSVSELLGNASDGNTCTVPKCKFLVHDPLSQNKGLPHDCKDKGKSSLMGVTALSCGGAGTSSQATLSSILVTGGADGCVKQWEMLQYKSSRSSNGDAKGESGNSWKLVHWPRLPTQRTKARAHMFQGHYGPVTAIKCDTEDNTSKILSAGLDGSIRVWNPKSGNEMYRMDGFDDLTSICLDKEILVTNGMNEYVCIHDFGKDDDLSNSYGMDW